MPAAVDQPFTEAVESFLYYLGASKPSPHTITAYRADLIGVGARIAPTELTLADLTRSPLRRAFSSWAGDHAASSVRRAHSSWTAFFRYLVSEDLIEGSPMEAVPKPRQPDDPVKSIRGNAFQIAARLLEAAGTVDPRARSQWPERDVAMIGLFVVTGIRLSEAINLTMRSIDGPPDQRRLTVVGKRNKTRTVPIWPALDETINLCHASRVARFPDCDLTNPAAPMFVDVRGRKPKPSQVEYWIEQIYRRAGIRADVPPGALVHALRHTFAMGLIASGGTVLEAQQLLGHASLTTTQRYVTATAEGLRGATREHPAQAALRNALAPTDTL
jgi:integrase/recombinase XerC